jgi:hypothetical protein
VTTTGRPPTLDQARTAARRILGRRETRRDQHPDRTDLARAVEHWPGDEDLLGVVDFVRQHTDAPAGILADDAADQILILRHLDHEVAQRCMYAIRLARRAGTTWSTIAAALGVGSPQAAEQALLRLEELFEGDGARDDTAARARRRTRPAPEPVAAYPGLRLALAGLLAHRRELPDNVDAALGYFRLETTGRADMTDGQLARGLRWFLDCDLAGVPLSPPAAAAADRVAAIVGPPSGRYG